MRCASPPESVAAARESVRYCRPTLCKKPRRLRISLDDAPGDHCLHIGQLRFERVKKAQTLRYGEIAELGDIHSADGDGEDFLPETAAAAVRAGRFRHALLDLRAHGRALRFAVTALEVGRDALEGLVERSLAALLIVMERQLLAARAVEDHFARLFRQITDGSIKTEMVFFSRALQKYMREIVSPRTLFQPDATMPPPRMESDGFGIMSSGSTRSCVPRPVQLGQAP